MTHRTKMRSWFTHRFTLQLSLNPYRRCAAQKPYCIPNPARHAVFRSTRRPVSPPCPPRPPADYPPPPRSFAFHPTEAFMGAVSTHEFARTFDEAVLPDLWRRRTQLSDD